MKLFVRSSSISWHLSLSLKSGLSTKESLNSKVGNPMIRPEIKPHKKKRFSSETLAHPCHHYHPPHSNAECVALLQRFMRKFLFTSALWTFIKPNFCSSQLEIMRLLLVTLDNTRKPAVACGMALLVNVQTLSLMRQVAHKNLPYQTTHSYTFHIYVTLDHKTSLKSHGYIWGNSQKYTVWVRIIDFSFMSKIIRTLSKDHVPWTYFVNVLQ